MAGSGARPSQNQQRRTSPGGAWCSGASTPANEAKPGACSGRRAAGTRHAQGPRRRRQGAYPHPRARLRARKMAHSATQGRHAVFGCGTTPLDSHRIGPRVRLDRPSSVFPHSTTPQMRGAATSRSWGPSSAYTSAAVVRAQDSVAAACARKRSIPKLPATPLMECACVLIAVSLCGNQSVSLGTAAMFSAQTRTRSPRDTRPYPESSTSRTPRHTKN